MELGEYDLIEKNRQVQADLQLYHRLCEIIRRIRHQPNGKPIGYRICDAKMKRRIYLRRTRLRRFITAWKSLRKKRLLAFDTPAALAWRLDLWLRANHAWDIDTQLDSDSNPILRATYRWGDAIYLQLFNAGFNLPENLLNYLGADLIGHLQQVFYACSHWPNPVGVNAETCTKQVHYFSEAEEAVLLLLLNAYPGAMRTAELAEKSGWKGSYIRGILGKLGKAELLKSMGRERGYILREKGLGIARKICHKNIL